MTWLNRCKGLVKAYEVRIAWSILVAGLGGVLIWVGVLLGFVVEAEAIGAVGGILLAIGLVIWALITLANDWDEKQRAKRRFRE